VVHWRLSDGKMINSFETPFWKRTGDISADGTTLAIAISDLDQQEELHIWNTNSAKMIMLDVENIFLIDHLALAPDNNTLAISFADGQLLLMKISDGRLLKKFEYFASYIDDVFMLPDGKRFASLSQYFRHPVLRFWNLADGSLVNDVDLNLYHADNANRIVLSPNGAMLAVAGDNLQLWEFPNGKLLKTFNGEGGYPRVDDVIFTPDSAYVIYSTFGMVKFAKTTGEITQTIEPAGDPLCVFNDGQTVMMSGDGVQYRNIVDGKLVSRILDGRYGPWLYFSPGCDMFGLMSWDGYFKVLQNNDTQLAKPVNIFDLRADGVYLIGPIAFSPNRDLVAVQEAIRKIRIFSLLTGKTVAVLAGHLRDITSLNFTSDGTLLISSSADGTIRFWGINP